ncbi:MAG: NAD(P)-binding domain-containing protein [Gemmatimonadota bacterium]|jgi:uncharacterized protein YbjT (DUF2867 family)
MPSIAFLGTGLLGGAFVEAALGRGETVTVWNRTAAKAVPLASRGARVAATPADAVRGESPRVFRRLGFPLGQGSPDITPRLARADDGRIA